MNETYEWLYDHYALPLMRVKKDADTIKQEIMLLSHTSESLRLRDRMEDLCLLWGTESFALGVQFGLRLMAGQCADGLNLL